jgi:hypothetical protein
MKLVITFAHTPNRFRDLGNGFLLRPHFGNFSVGERPAVGRLMPCGAFGFLRRLGYCGHAPPLGIEPWNYWKGESVCDLRNRGLGENFRLELIRHRFRARVRHPAHGLHELQIHLVRDDHYV